MSADDQRAAEDERAVRSWLTDIVEDEPEGAYEGHTYEEVRDATRALALLDRLRAELAETRAELHGATGAAAVLRERGDALADAKNWVGHVVEAERRRSVRGDAPAQPPAVRYLSSVCDTCEHTYNAHASTGACEMCSCQRFRDLPPLNRDRAPAPPLSPEWAAAPADDTDAPDRSWWISWYGAGAFEYHGPWWITGYEGGGAERATICAAVQAPTEDAARQVITDAHDSPLPAIDWRFVESRPHDWSPFTDRFQRADWMQWGSQGGGA